jgi:DNA-binding winged helix-turn-helix (wHTH) protein
LAATSRFRFGEFELDAAAYQLKRGVDSVHLERRPMDLLTLLVQRSGELVSREEIVERVWGQDLFVEAEAGINTAIRKVRRALQDSPERPVYVETVPGKGYRFIGRVHGPRLVTLAVLPAVSFDPVPDRQYLADGLTEEVIAALGLVDPEHLRVIGRTSMMTYKATAKSLSRIGEELGAEFLVETSLRADAAIVRITARLIRASDQVQIWCASFDGDGERSVLQFQQQLSIAIASQVCSTISSEKLSAISTRHPLHSEAYDLYLRGRFLWHRLSGETTRGAIEHYKRAVVIDPDYGLAWAGLGVAFAASPITGDVPAMRVWPEAREAAAHALRSAPNLAESHTADGFVKFWLDWDLPAAKQAFQRALELDPSDALAHRTLGIVLAYLDRREEAKALGAKACDLDPLNAAHYALQSQIAFFGRDFESSLAFAQRSTVVDHEFWIGHLQLAQAAEQLDEHQIALTALEQAGIFSGVNSKVLALQGYIFAKEGRDRQALDVLATLKARSAQYFVPPYSQALVLLGLKQLDRAMVCLERAFEVHDVHLNFLLVDAKWDLLRSDTRFTQLLKRCRFHGATAPAGRTG